MAVGNSSVVGRAVGAAAGASPVSVPKSGQLLYSDASLSLGTKTIPKVMTNIKAPNGYPASALTFSLVVTDTVNSTAPTSPTVIETALAALEIDAADGTVLAYIQGINGEFVRWQHRLNNDGFYVASTAPADTTAGAYTSTFTFTLNHFAIRNEDFPISIKPTYNTLASRATTPQDMTSEITSFQVWSSFIPLAAYTPTVLRTKNLTRSATGILSFGQELDAVKILDLSMDFTADSNLNDSSTFNLAVDNNSLISNTSYVQLIGQENQTYQISTPHIDGFFPFNVSDGNALVDGKRNITLSANIGSAPTLTNLYMVEAR